jgi:hypothetical protein
MHQNYQKYLLASRSKMIGNSSELFMPKIRQSKSFANNIVIFLMADIALECKPGKVD